MESRNDMLHNIPKKYWIWSYVGAWKEPQFPHLGLPRENSPCRGEGAYPLSSNRVRQRGELNRAPQLKLSDQQISSTIMSSTELTLIRQD